MGSLVLQVLVMILIALLAGCYFDGLLVLLPAQNQLSASSYIEVEQANTRVGTIRYRILVFASILSQLSLLLFSHNLQSGLFWLSLLSMLLVIAGLLITVLRVVPINRQVHTWSPQVPPPHWQDIRHQWHVYHAWRTGLVLIAMLAQFFAILLPLFH
jgi:hypothetical protein